MRFASLGSVTEFARGVTFKPTDVVPPGTPDSITCLRTKNVQVRLEVDDVLTVPIQVVKRDDQRLRCGDILISSANSWNLVGKCSWVPKLPWPATFGGFVTVLRGDAVHVDQRYLYHWFSSDRVQLAVRNCARQTTNIANLSLDRCRNLPIPLPPIEEQRRIAAVLDAADALRAKRREAIAKLDSLTQAIFIDMFGDLARNNRQWPVVPIGDFVEGFQTGRSVSAAPNETDGDYRVLKVSAVTSLTYKPDQAKPVPPGYQPRASHIVRAGDLLMSRANTSELVGRCAYVQETPPAMLLPDKLWRFMWSQPQRAEPRFVWKALQNRRFRGDIADIATGSSGSMKNISQKGFLRLTIPLPPIGLQTAFTARFRAITDLGSQKAAELQALDTLFASLQQRAFRGEL